MKIHLKGKADSRRVWLNGKELTPAKSKKFRNHSPDGFNWGYGGSGPAQLALAICVELAGSTRVNGMHYQDLKFKHIGPLPQGKDFDVQFDI